jgi:hypothetical protein
MKNHTQFTAPLKFRYDLCRLSLTLCGLENFDLPTGVVFIPTRNLRLNSIESQCSPCRPTYIISDEGDCRFLSEDESYSDFHDVSFVGYEIDYLTKATWRSFNNKVTIVAELKGFQWVLTYSSSEEINRDEAFYFRSMMEFIYDVKNIKIERALRPEVLIQFCSDLINHYEEIIKIGINPSGDSPKMRRDWAFLLLSIFETKLIPFMSLGQVMERVSIRDCA